mmetsp:Transcript_13484/g.38657  ORF Transcript_13484/g.38657 Transcript_13484/m.38657 type:complete len:202 (-) Transcript_13484:299-904(-)
MTFQCLLLALPITAAVPQPLTSVDVEKYVGRWYQTYASATVKFTFELGGNCVTADYAATSAPGVVSVLNTVRLFPNLAYWFPRIFTGVKINGFAAQSPDTAGALSVALGPLVGGAADQRFSDPGNYWIVKLGAVVDGKYDYAIVSEGSMSQLYVLVRNVERFRANDETEVLGWLEEQGFTSPLSKPLPTNQDGCNYEVYDA